MSPTPWLFARAVRLSAVALVTLFFTISFFKSERLQDSALQAIAKSKDVLQAGGVIAPDVEVTLVISHTRTGDAGDDDIKWLDGAFPEWHTRIYAGEDLVPAGAVVAKQSQEALAYLTYIIDQYDDLTPITIFRHSSRFQWHTDDPTWDGLRLLRRLRKDYIYRDGYANLRCAWNPGCPLDLSPFKFDVDAALKHDDEATIHFLNAWNFTLPDEPVPKKIAQPRYGEFAVTRNVIWRRPKMLWERARQWLVEVELEDTHGGRVFDALWHILLDQNSVLCPTAEVCYCEKFGLCELTCESDGECRAVWQNSGEALPKGWPDIGLDGKKQDYSKLKAATDHVGFVLPEDLIMR